MSEEKADAVHVYLPMDGLVVSEKPPIPADEEAVNVVRAHLEREGWSDITIDAVPDPNNRDNLIAHIQAQPPPIPATVVTFAVSEDTDGR